jgi:arginyl-tRNA synthetase
MKYEQFIEETGRKITGLFGEAAKSCPPPACQMPPAHVRAHVSIPWAMTAAKALRKSPLEIAKQVAQSVASVKGVKAAVAVPPGYVNVEFEEDIVFSGFSSAIKNPDSFTKLDNPPSRKILLEFVSANPTGPLHVASGRGAALGDGLARVMRALGYTADCEYYVNDIGVQAGLLGQSLKARYEGKEPPAEGYQGDYVTEMAKQLPAEASGWDVNKFAAYGIEQLFATHQKDMKTFGVDFKCWFRESKLHEKGQVKATLEKLKSLGKTYEKEGAVWFGSTSEETGDDDKDRVLVRSTGTTTYFLNDLAYHLDKLSRGYDRLIDILGADHHGYVPRMEAGLAALGCAPENFRVIIHQQVSLLKNGAAVKMSKRAGEFIRLSELMEDVGPDACRFFFSSRTPNTQLTFDIDLAKKRSQENPVYYVQYVHARVCSIFRKAQEAGKAGLAEGAISVENIAPQEASLITRLMWFEETLKICARDLSPHHLTSYLTDLSGDFHKFYDSCRVLDENPDGVIARRLLLCAMTRTVIGRGLGLIGVSAPDTM